MKFQGVTKLNTSLSSVNANLTKSDYLLYKEKTTILSEFLRYMSVWRADK